MKDQILPEIPEQNVPQAHSMYEQLRKTSQKWFTTGSNRRIFTNSAFSPSQLSPREGLAFSERSIHSRQALWQDGAEGAQKARVLLIMREQIEIAYSEYAARFKGVLQDQARKIKLLGDLLVKNQMELDKKNKIIQGLIKIVQNKDNHKRITGFQKINAKVKQNEQKLSDLQRVIQKLQKQQNGAGSKLKILQKHYKEKLQKISSNYASKLSEVTQEFQQRIDKMQKVIALSQTEPKTNRRTIKDSPNSTSLNQNIQNLSSELSDLRQQIESFKRKKYKYENIDVETVRKQIEKIHQKIQRYEQASKLRVERSPNLKASVTTHATRTEQNINIETRYSLTSKTRFLNKYKSLINTRPTNGPSLPIRRKQSCSSESQSQSQVEETLVVEQGNIDRLNKIILEMKICTPVRIEIDQTGYAKSVDTGMYLVDTLGNGFEFTEEEIVQLTNKGLIVC